MTTRSGRSVVAPGSVRVAGQPRRRAVSAGRPARFLAGWKLALRTSRRELRRAKGRSLLIMIMVGGPALLISALAMFLMSPSQQNQLPTSIGDTQAAIMTGDVRSQVAQSPTLSAGYTTLDRPALRIGGQGAPANSRGADDPARSRGSDSTASSRGSDSTPGWTAEQIGQVIDGHIITSMTGEVTLALSSPLRMQAGYLPVADMARTGLVKLRDGRWPTGDHEILITGSQRHGVQVGQRVRISGRQTAKGSGRRSAEPQPYTIVGRVALPDSGIATLDSLEGELLVGDPALMPPRCTDSTCAFLVDRTAPVTWSDVRKLNRYGLIALSRAVVQDPPDASRIDPSMRGAEVVDVNAIAWYVLVGAGFLFEAMLLAGPAFAISAARQRHTMGLLAGNGATRSQLRRQLLAQALLLGVAAGLLGVALGCLTGRYLDAGISAVEGNWAAPKNVSWPAAAAVLAGTTVASLIAALLPARGAGKLDLVTVLRGRSSSADPRVITPILGGSMLSLGLVTVMVLGVKGSAEMTTRYVMGVGTAAALIGSMLLIPALLRLLGRLSGGLGLTLRLALRDSSRQLHRAAPAVAAVVAATAMFTIMATSLNSEDAGDRRTYVPETHPGWGIVDNSPDAVDLIRSQHPDWTVSPHRAVFGPQRNTGLSDQVVGFVPDGCTAEQTVKTYGVYSAHCGEALVSYDIPYLMATDLDQLRARAELPAAARAVFEAGGVLLRDDAVHSNDRSYVPGQALMTGPDHSVTLAIGKTRPSGGKDTPQVRLVSQHRLPAAIVDHRLIADIFPSANTDILGLMSAAALQQPGITTVVDSYDVIPAGRAISVADEAAINKQLSDQDQLLVERGFHSQLRPYWIALGGGAAVLLLIAALISTALSQVEARADLATLSAIGAPPVLRRRFAAAQAAIIVIIGGVLGELIGLVCGVGFTVSNLRGMSGTPLVIAIPWSVLGLVVVGPALLTALIAAAGARPVQAMTRRLG